MTILSKVGVPPIKKRYLAGIAGVLSTFIAYNVCVERIEPTERGGKRVWSQIASTVPLAPGRYIQIPFYSEIDTLQVSLQTVHVEPFVVQTVDNQRITLDINLSYTIPDSAVLHLLYEVGKSGNGDIRKNIDPIVRDRVSRVYASKNTNYLSKDRVEIQNEITHVVHDELNRLFGVNVESLQIASITYSDAFVASNDQAVLEKNKAVAAENRVRTIELEARQKVAEAEGKAREQVAQAEGANKATILSAEAAARKMQLDSEAAGKARLIQAKAEADATILQATADRQARELRGQGEGAALAAAVQALGSAETYVSMLEAQAHARWTGTVPSTVINSANGAGMMPLILPSPAAGQAK